MVVGGEYLIGGSALVVRGDYFNAMTPRRLREGTDARKKLYGAARHRAMVSGTGYTCGGSERTSMNDEQKKADAQRELLFQKRIAELGFQRQRLPWNLAETPVFNLPEEETKYHAEMELELEADAATAAEVERRILFDLTSHTYNFKNFYKRLHYEWRRAKRYKRTLSVMLVGIDRLQLVADQFGEEGRDALIRAAAKILMSSIRDVDIPGRCRDDVFGVILPETKVEGAEV